jgi:hypothetical protein
MIGFLRAWPGKPLPIIVNVAMLHKSTESTEKKNKKKKHTHTHTQTKQTSKHAEKQQRDCKHGHGRVLSARSLPLSAI